MSYKWLMKGSGSRGWMTGPGEGERLVHDRRIPLVRLPRISAMSTTGRSLLNGLNDQIEVIGEAVWGSHGGLLAMRGSRERQREIVESD